MTQHTIHDTLPSGFTVANDLQAEAFHATGSINGASKVCLVRTATGVDVAFRSRPPMFVKSIMSTLGRGDVDSAEEYVAEYNKGWRYAREHESGHPGGSFAMEDGWLDAVAGRAKWHLTYCADHDACGEG